MSIIKVLWVEEETSENLELLRIQLELDRRIELKIAGNAREAIEFLNWDVFDVILLDILLPPGYDDHWISIRTQTEQLGLELVKHIFQPSSQILPENIRPEKFGVFTIERQKDIQDIFKSGGGPIDDQNYRNKDSIHDGKELIAFILEIIAT